MALTSTLPEVVKVDPASMLMLLPVEAPVMLQPVGTVHAYETALGTATIL